MGGCMAKCGIGDKDKGDNATAGFKDPMPRPQVMMANRESSSISSGLSAAERRNRSQGSTPRKQRESYDRKRKSILKSLSSRSKSQASALRKQRESIASRARDAQETRQAQQILQARQVELQQTQAQERQARTQAQAQCAAPQPQQIRQSQQAQQAGQPQQLIVDVKVKCGENKDRPCKVARKPRRFGKGPPKQPQGNADGSQQPPDPSQRPTTARPTPTMPGSVNDSEDAAKHAIQSKVEWRGNRKVVVMRDGKIKRVPKKLNKT